MSLLSYDEVRPWAQAIKDKVQSRQMPPWFPDPQHGTFKNDARLTQPEIDTLVAWVDAGAPSGDLADLPPVPTFSDGWQLGPPDHIVRLPEVTVPADGNDYYPDVQFKMDVSEQRWIRAIEIRPSNRSVTHHSVIFTNGDPNTSGASGFFDVLAVWSVGTNPHVFAEGMGRWVYPDQQLRVNAHYHPSGQVETDVTEIGLYFGEGEMKDEEGGHGGAGWHHVVRDPAARRESRSPRLVHHRPGCQRYFVLPPHALPREGHAAHCQLSER